jgi:4-phosphopantoate--beta-alanine ligase
MEEIPKSHPRYKSLITREKLVEGFKEGIVAFQGLIAHGRGEAFDYILGEKTHDFALEAERAAVLLMLKAKKPVISVNGNTACLVAKELVKLSEVLNAPLEINLFHWSKERVERIEKFLKSYGGRVLAACDAELEGLHSKRRIVDRRGIYVADVVLVALEDGDRCEILKKHGKKVIAIDLNPLSRTSLMADITIVDNVTRAIPNMMKIAVELRELENSNKIKEFRGFDNRQNLSKAIQAILEYLSKTSKNLVEL